MTEVLDEFQGRQNFYLDDFQLQACWALEDGYGVLVAAPTGAGKTIVGEFAIQLALARKQRVFYTTPIKALSNQKYHDLLAQYGPEKVGLLTGDTSINHDAQIIVMTTEVLRNMLYAEDLALQEVAFVVMDEVHYLADRFRGAVWEEVILHLPRTVQLVSLSATVSNAEEFGDWLTTVRGKTSVVVSEERPVPLWQHVFAAGEIYDLFDAKSKGKTPQVNRQLRELNYQASAKSRSIAAGRKGRRRPGRDQERVFRRRPSRVRTVRALESAKLLPAIYFIFSRAGCDAAVQQCLRAGMDLVHDSDRKAIRKAADEVARQLPEEDLAILDYGSWRDSLLHGIAAHHAGMLPIFKEAVERLFIAGHLRVVFATETLALGVNMPAKSVVLEKLEKFNGQEHVNLTAGEYTQLTGRAGRRGIDVEGHAVVLWQPGEDPEVLARLASRRSYPLNSSFQPSYNMGINLLASFGRLRAREILQQSFAQFQLDRSLHTLAQQAQEQEETLAQYERSMSCEHEDPCPNPQSHQRWQKRYRKLQRQHQRLLKSIHQRTESLAATFDRICGILTDYGFIQSTTEGELLPSREGQQLRRIYGERDLLLALALQDGLFDSLTPEELAAVSTALVYHGKREEPQPRSNLGSLELSRAAQGLYDWGIGLNQREEAAKVPLTPPPDFALVRPMYDWASGADLEYVLGESQLAAGDFVRWSKQVIDILGQLAQVGEALESEADFRRRCRAAIDCVRRGVVAYSSTID